MQKTQSPLRRTQSARAAHAGEAVPHDESHHESIIMRPIPKTVSAGHSPWTKPTNLPTPCLPPLAVLPEPSSSSPSILNRKEDQQDLSKTARAPVTKAVQPTLNHVHQEVPTSNDESAERIVERSDDDSIDYGPNKRLPWDFLYPKVEDPKWWQLISSSDVPITGGQERDWKANPPKMGDEFVRLGPAITPPECPYTYPELAHCPYFGDPDFSKELDDAYSINCMVQGLRQSKYGAEIADTWKKGSTPEESRELWRIEAARREAAWEVYSDSEESDESR